MKKECVAGFNLIEAYASAQAAIERIEERRRLSPVRHAWKVRMAIAERQALSRIDGYPLDIDDIQVNGRGIVSASQYALTRYGQAIGKAITLNELITQPHAVLSWLGMESENGFCDTSVSNVTSWQSNIAILPPAPPLLQSAIFAYRWMKLRPLGRGDVVAGLLAGDRWGPGRWVGSSGGLTALGLEALQSGWRNLNEEDFTRTWLTAISRGATTHLDMEMRLRSFASRASAALQGRKRMGNMQDLLQLAMSRPRLTSRVVSLDLKITPAGAIKLLTMATEIGLLIEQTGHSTYRSYSIPVASPSARNETNASLDALDPYSA